jgi:hypothetical protein
MINLIPAEAKKHLVREYWIRSVTVWFFLWAFVLVLGVALLVPSYVLLNLQVKAYSETAETAGEKNANFEAVAKELERASKTAASLSDHLSHPPMTSYIELLRSFETDSISVTQVGLERDGDKIGLIKMNGIAADRQALAAFRNRMLEDELIETVDLPISNLAKDRQIPFELSITMVKEKTP